MTSEEKDKLIKKLGEALGSAVDHLDYTGWGGDSWERECAQGIESDIRSALDGYQALSSPKVESAMPTVFVCPHCKREFLAKHSLNGHKKRSLRCKSLRHHLKQETTNHEKP